MLLFTQYLTLKEKKKLVYASIVPLFSKRLLLKCWIVFKQHQRALDRAILNILVVQQALVDFQEDYDRLRVISYMNCDVFLVCYSVINRESLASVQDHWIPEIKHYLPKTPYILVATQTDRRDEVDLSLNKVRNAFYLYF